MLVVPAASGGGALAKACRGIDPSLAGLCHGGEQLAVAGAGLCRYAGLPESACASLPLSPQVRHEAVAAYQGSWVHRALVLQYQLAGDVAMRDIPWVGSQDSFNSSAEMRGRPSRTRTPTSSFR